ncbi:hypothetical protein ATI61_116194 [Archangium gephyra]|uniref:Trichohyalin n=1 Tax=Archangium gephyra TaxID=48 RepID=A0AAC8TFC1_9BACT|nr:hypothetical protein [Archangium gephyra]AKJ03947.1 Trichohyalin [Archangium gephyra]REG23722.1 hypothetical protein ATI61_116194 [Archangium gephyra]
MKTLKPFSSALAAALLLAGSAQAQNQKPRAPEPHEIRAPDRHEERQDAAERRDDRKDVAELERVLERFDNARARRHNAAELATVDNRLRELLRAELAEGREEKSQARAETRREWGESRAENRDDVRDARVEAASQTARKTIARELNSLMGARSQAQLSRKRELIVELVRLGKQELRQDRQEQREDRKDRKDRRY